MEEWRTPERRHNMITKIAEAMRAYPEVLNRSPGDIENTIYQKAKIEAEYNQTVGKVILSIKHQGQRQQAAAAGYRPNMGYPGGQIQQQMVRPPQQQQYYTNQRPHMGPVGSYPPQMMGPGMGGHSHIPGMGPSPAMMVQHPQPYATRMAPSQMMNNPGMGNMGMGMMPTGMPPGRQINMIQQRPPPHVVATGPQPGMGVEQPVTAMPNPSYPFGRQDNTTGMISRPPAASSPFAVAGYQGSPSAVNIPASHSPAPPPSGPQVPSPAPAKMPSQPQAPSPRGLMVNSPSTPWNPSSMAAGSPGQPAMGPEANEAYMRKLQELQVYVPLVARMIERLNRQQGDDRTKNEQYLKLNSLYSLLNDKNKRVPLQTLEKCERALEKLFEKPTGGQPTTPTSLPPPSVPSLLDPQEPPSSVPAPPLPPSPPLTTSCSLMDFKMPHSPAPLATALFPTFKPAAGPISRLPPEKRARLEEQAKHDMVIALRREIAHLRNFSVKQVSNDKIDGTVNLECSLVDDGLPAVPPLNVQIPHDYPATSPECVMAAYQGELKSNFLREVSRLLLEQLTHCDHNYSLSYILQTWESSVLKVTSAMISTRE